MLPGKLLYKVKKPDKSWHFDEKSINPDVFTDILQYFQNSWQILTIPDIVDTMIIKNSSIIELQIEKNHAYEKTNYRAAKRSTSGF